MQFLMKSASVIRSTPTGEDESEDEETDQNDLFNRLKNDFIQKKLGIKSIKFYFYRKKS